jgi:23S rRNA (uracil1939-C5)-methyltransferase
MAGPTQDDAYVELDVDRLAYEGAAVGRIDGHVYFVTGAAPGDRVRARITKRRKRLVEARVVEVLRRGATRIQPPCPVADRCGGCDWQHVDYLAQIDAKHQILVDAFERSAKMPEPPVAPVIASPEQLGYRNRIRLHVDAKRLCYFERNSRRPVEVGDCLIADARVRSAFPLVRRLIEALEGTVLEAEIASRGELPGVVVALTCRGRLRSKDNRTVAGTLREAAPEIAGIVMHGPRWHRVWGDTRRRFVVEEGALAIECIDTSFGQVNAGANRLLVEEVLAAAGLEGAESVWDLYAGAGNLSLPLARTAARVIAVERDAGAMATARAAAASHGIENVTFYAADVENWLRLANEPPDLAVVNPPRSGLARVADALAASRPRRLVYVSCNPATLARDAAALAERGYRLEQVRPVDLFPQTCRIEAVCQLVLT